MAREMATADRSQSPAAGIHRLSLPMPYGFRQVNAYLVEDDPLTLVDTGPNWRGALAALEEALAERGLRIEQLQRIVLTHQHIDHIGLAQTLADRSGAEICAIDLLAPWLADYDRAKSDDDEYAEAQMLRHGVPAETVAATHTWQADHRVYGAAAHVTRLLADGEALEFADRRWTILRRPGHSPSDTVFHDEVRRQLVGGDHLIAPRSADPLIARPLGPGQQEGTETGAIVSYLGSLRATRQLAADTLFPGHGELITEPNALIDERIAEHHDRAAQIASLLTDRSQNGYEIAQRLRDDRPGILTLLTLSHVLGHLGVLLERGEAELRLDNGVRFALAARAAD